jgi:hypothetical protein
VGLPTFLLVLRELAHLHGGWLALEPRVEIKARLADHFYDDARGVAKLARRLTELGEPVPSVAVTGRLGRATTAQEYLDVAYGEVKPALASAVRAEIAGLDALVEQPTLRLLTQIAHRQERHVVEIPVAHRPAGIETQPGSLDVLPPLERPARDPYVRVADEESGDVHGLMHAKLCDAELTSRSSHEHPGMPWDFHLDMARQTWDALRHAEVVDRLMATELDRHWGDRPVGFASFAEAYGMDLPGRLAWLHATSDRRAAEPSEYAVLERLAPDERMHGRNAQRWRAQLVGAES